MRLDDEPRIAVSTLVDATTDDLWPIVTDIALPPRWSTELDSAEWIDEGPAVGARFVGRNRLGDRSWEVVCTVVELDPSRRFTWSVGDPEAPAATWGYEVEDAEGGVELRHWCRIGLGRSGLRRAVEAHPDDEEAIVRFRLDDLQSNMQTVVEGMRALAERAPGVG